MIILARNEPQSELSTTVMEMPSSSTVLPHCDGDDDENDQDSTTTKVQTDTKGLKLLGWSAKRKAVACILYIADPESFALPFYHGPRCPPGSAQYGQ